MLPRFAPTFGVLAAAMFVAAWTATAAPSYRATDLGVLYSSASEWAVPYAINDAGQIAALRSTTAAATSTPSAGQTAR